MTNPSVLPEPIALIFKFIAVFRIIVQSVVSKIKQLTNAIADFYKSLFSFIWAFVYYVVGHFCIISLLSWSEGFLGFVKKMCDSALKTIAIYIALIKQKEKEKKNQEEVKKKMKMKTDIESQMGKKSVRPASSHERSITDEDDEEDSSNEMENLNSRQKREMMQDKISRLESNIENEEKEKNKMMKQNDQIVMKLNSKDANIVKERKQNSLNLSKVDGLQKQIEAKDLEIKKLQNYSDQKLRKQIQKMQEQLGQTMAELTSSSN